MKASQWGRCNRSGASEGSVKTAHRQHNAFSVCQTLKTPRSIRTQKNKRWPCAAPPQPISEVDVAASLWGCCNGSGESERRIGAARRQHTALSICQTLGDPENQK